MSVVKKFIAMCKRSFGIGFLSLSFISSVFCIQTQTPEIQADSYMYNHLAQVAEYEEVRDLLVGQPRLHDAFTEVTGWMFDRTRPTVAERKKAQELLKRIDTSPRLLKQDKKQIQAVLRRTTGRTWKAGHTIGVSAVVITAAAALIAARVALKNKQSTGLSAGGGSGRPVVSGAVAPGTGAGVGAGSGAGAGAGSEISPVDADIARCHQAFIYGNGEIPEVLQKRVGVCEMQGRRFDGMEDAVIVKVNGDNNFCLLAVCDGHSGVQAALYAQQHFFDHLERSLLDGGDISDERIQRSIIAFDETLKREPSIATSGTTLTAALFLPDGTLKLVNLGDSRVVGVTAHGECVFTTTDHKPHDAAEQQRVSHAGGTVSTELMEYGGASEVRLLGAASGLGVARALGDFDYKRGTDQGILDDGTSATNYIVSNVATITTISSQQLATARYVVLACDGLWDVMDNAQVAKYVVRLPTQNTPDEIASALTKKAYETKLPGGADNRDNISVVVLDLGPVSDRLSFTLRK